MTLPLSKIKKVETMDGDGAVDIDSKRFYMPTVLTADCPVCGKEVVRRLDEDYLSYPTANIVGRMSMMCVTNAASGEGHEFEVPYILMVSIEVPEEEP